MISGASFARLRRRSGRGSLTVYSVPYTFVGLHIRAVGEEPNAVDTAGLSVNRLRYTALLCTGFMCGLSGITLSMAQNGGFVREMSAGMGYMAWPL